MANLIPSLNSVKRKMTSGERRFAERLESHLEDDYLCWYDVPVGPHSMHPDFIVLHPRRGILILEVKDWRRDHIHAMDKTAAYIHTGGGLKKLVNPLEQARAYAHVIVNVLEKDPSLIRPEGVAHAGKLGFPWGYGVILTRIARQGFKETDLPEVLPGNRVICQDEMTESVDPEDFQKRLWDMFSVHFDTLMTMPQIDRVRWHLFPEIRVKPTQGQLDLEENEEAFESTLETVPDLIRAMHLAQMLNKPILILCYNKSLAAYLSGIIEEKGLSEKVQVRNFHGWCFDQLRLYGVEKPTEKGDEFFSALVRKVIDSVETGRYRVPSMEPF